MAPSSSLFAIRQTFTAGRSVFATRRIPAATHLLTAPDLATSVINREYRKEVCAQCFAYNRGITWKHKDTQTGTGCVWCTEACEHGWRTRHDNVAVEAMRAVEVFIAKSRSGIDRKSDVPMLDVSGPAPDEEEVARVWRLAAEQGRLIQGARTSSSPSKPENKALQVAIAEPPVPMILYYLLSAVLLAHSEPQQWTTLLDLQGATQPYPSSSVLDQHAKSYLQLLSCLPPALFSHVTPDSLLAAANRDAHNSFGLRSLDDGGSEMFGYGVWPSASYWNHSCDPNVTKDRIGRSWQFRTSRDVEEGEELNITYLGGDEDDLGLEERRRRLWQTWAFDCMCMKCVGESMA